MSCPDVIALDAMSDSGGRIEDMTREQQEIYRRMSPAERVSAGCALHDFAFQRVLLDLKRRFPEASEAELLKQATRRFLGEAAAVL